MMDETLFSVHVFREDKLWEVTVFLPFEATFTSSWSFGMPLGHANGLAWTVSTLIFHYAVFGTLCRWLVAPYVRDERRLLHFPIAATALLSVIIPCVCFRFPTWFGAPEHNWGMMHFYMGARSNPLVRLPTFLIGMQLAAATIQNKRHPVQFNWAALADGLSVLILCGYVGVTFFPDWTLGTNGRHFDLARRGYVEFFSAPIFALWFRALSETDQSWSYKLLTLKPFMVIGEWSFCIYLSQFLVWGTTNLFLGERQVTALGAQILRADGQLRAQHPDWTRHLFVLELVVVSGLMFKFIEEPSRKYLMKRIDATWKPAAPAKVADDEWAVTQLRIRRPQDPREVCGKCHAVLRFVDAKFCTGCGAIVASPVQKRDSKSTADTDAMETSVIGKTLEA
jgi:peptidoglycan/LPS O-acetylase OafA/YrhL